LAIKLTIPKIKVILADDCIRAFVPHKLDPKKTVFYKLIA